MGAPHHCLEAFVHLHMQVFIQSISIHQALGCVVSTGSGQTHKAESLLQAQRQWCDTQAHHMAGPGMSVQHVGIKEVDERM